MAEKVYTSKGVVLLKQAFGEASISALILTEDFGLVRVRAQSARLSKGKLRYALEPLTKGEFSFVRGKEMYRLIGQEVEERLLNNESAQSRRALGQIGRLLLRLMPGEDVHPNLFRIVCGGFKFISTCENTDIPDAECMMVLSILGALGYLPEDASLSPLAARPLSEEVLHEVKGLRPRAVKIINAVLSESGL